MLSFRSYVVMLSCLACATSFVFAYLCFAPRLPLPAMEIRSPRDYAGLECLSAARSDSAWSFRVRNNTSLSFHLSGEDAFSIMILTPEGLKPAGPGVSITLPIDIPAGETALLTLHCTEGRHFVVLVPGQSLKFDLEP
jgi:hypothetical protein